MRGFINSETLTDIADAIRAKTGDAATLAPGAMAAAIAALPEGAGAREFVENGFPQEAPWNDHGVWNDEELTKIGIRLQYLEIPRVIALPNVTTIDASAFANTAITSVTLNKATEIAAYAFNVCTSLTTVNLPKVETIGLKCFYGCTALNSVTIPAATTLSGEAFRNCRALTSINLPNVTAVLHNNSSSTYGSCFQACSNLTTVRFGKTCTIGTGLYTQAFSQCTALTDIYVPWSEGDVPGAPWGAPNATIHYDTPYTEV